MVLCGFLYVFTTPCRDRLSIILGVYKIETVLLSIESIVSLLVKAKGYLVTVRIERENRHYEWYNKWSQNAKVVPKERKP